jgi:hypothetical protein
VELRPPRGGDKTKPAPRFEEPVEGARTQPCATPVDASDRSPADDRGRARTRRANRAPCRRFRRSSRIAVGVWSSLASFHHLSSPAGGPRRHGRRTVRLELSTNLAARSITWRRLRDAVRVPRPPASVPSAAWFTAYAGTMPGRTIRTTQPYDFHELSAGQFEDLIRQLALTSSVDWARPPEPVGRLGSDHGRDVVAYEAVRAPTAT